MNLKKKIKRFFLSDNFLCTLFILSLIWIVSRIELNFELISPLEQALSDFEITDICFSHLSSADPSKAENNVTLVNIGNLSRAGIAEQIRTINRYNPKVVALDCFFEGKKDSLGDKVLARRLKNTQNLVMASKLMRPDLREQKFDSLKKSHPDFSTYATTHGYANMVAKEHDFRTCRYFTPQETYRNKKVEAFAVKIAQLYDSSKTADFLQRNYETEQIFYKGNVFSGNIYNNNSYDSTSHMKYAAIGVNELFNGEFDTSLIHDKIVILGYLGASIHDIKFWDEDRFYTPLNDKYAGKAFPDMFGAVVHANIVSMILDGNFINKTPEYVDLALNMLICFMNVALFSLLYKKVKIWYDGISIFIQLLETALLLILVVVIFEYFHLKMNFNLAIVFILLTENLVEIYYGFVKVGYIKYIRNKFNYH